MLLLRVGRVKNMGRIVSPGKVQGCWYWKNRVVAAVFSSAVRCIDLTVTCRSSTETSAFDLRRKQSRPSARDVVQ